jgi:hypothetical protein
MTMLLAPGMAIIAITTAQRYTQRNSIASNLPIRLQS